MPARSWKLRSLIVAAMLALASSGCAWVQRASVDSAENQADVGGSTNTISANGRYVVFSSSASDLVAGDTNDVYDVFVRDIVAGTTTRVSVDSAGHEGNESSWYGAISTDGRYVAFYSFASNLVAGDTNGQSDVFVRDIVAGTTTRVSISNAGLQADQGGSVPAISADGRYIAFLSYSTNLVAGDTNNAGDIFVRDTVAHTTTRVSLDSAGTQANNSSTDLPSISANGRYVAFLSYASNLVAGDTNGNEDAFVRDTVAGTTTRVNVDSAGTQANDNAFFPAISADGRYVAFWSWASNLVPNDTFPRRMCSCGTRWRGRPRQSASISPAAWATPASTVPRSRATAATSSSRPPGRTWYQAIRTRSRMCSRGTPWRARPHESA